jgi:enoyl-CoA hydratase/carnithine racemase
MAEGLELIVGDGVVDAVVDRGEDNLFTLDMCRELTGLLLDPPEGAHVLRLSARGPVFCLGRERSAETPEELRAEVRTLIGVLKALRSSPLVSVAAVSGDAAAFGVLVAARCDVAVAAPAARFSFPEVTIDLAPSVVLAVVPRVLGRRQAFWMAATGDAIGAAQAVELDLVNEVAPSLDALPGVVDERVAALRARSPRVHAEIRSYLEATADVSQDTAFALAEERLILGSLARRRD